MLASNEIHTSMTPTDKKIFLIFNLKYGIYNLHARPREPDCDNSQTVVTVMCQY